MIQSIFLCPFTRRAHKAMLYSFLVRIQQNQSVTLHSSDLHRLAKGLLLSPLTLRRQLLSFAQTKHFSVRKVEKGIEVRRFSTQPSYCGISIETDFIHKHALSSSELILFAAILLLQKKEKGALTRKQLACRTGFSVRQVAYSLKSLYKKGVLLRDKQHEEYVRNTKEGRIEDTRDRNVWVVPPHLLNLACFKIAPLKDSSGYPVINNRSFLFNPLNSSTKKSDLEFIWKFYKEKFKAHSFESLKGTEIALVKRKLSLKDPRTILHAIQSFVATPFLKVAHQFGWQEAIIECYNRKQCLIGDSSRHINKYSSHKPGLVWIIQHAQQIINHKYTPKDLTQAQKKWIKTRVAFKRTGVITLKSLSTNGFRIMWGL